MVTRIAQRFALKEETVWARVRELRAARHAHEQRRGEPASPAEQQRSARADPLERDLLTVLLAEPALVAVAQAEVSAREVHHLGLRRLLEGLYRLQAEGVPPELDRLRSRIDNPRLMEKALEMQEQGRAHADRAAWLKGVLERFRERRARPERQELQNQLHAASDHARALELLKQLQNRTGA
jgi:hypothetical protein